jgi:hypothetical protein
MIKHIHIRLTLWMRQRRLCISISSFLSRKSIETRIGLPRLGAAGRNQAVEAGQLVRVAAVTVEVLRIGAADALGSLPHLPQVGVEVAVAEGAVASYTTRIASRLG